MAGKLLLDSIDAWLLQQPSLVNQALKIDPSNAAAHGGVGVLLQQKGDLRAAVEELRRAVEPKPDSPEYHVNLGAVLADLGQHGGSILEFQKALEPESRRRGLPPRPATEAQRATFL